MSKKPKDETSPYVVAACQAVGNLAAKYESARDEIAMLKSDRAKVFELGRASRLITAERWNNLLEERDHLHAQLRDIHRLWMQESEACSDHSDLAFKMAEVARKAITTI